MLLLLLAFNFIFSFFQDKPKLPRITPPGTLQVEENKFIDTDFVMNIHWKEFLYFIKKDSSTAYYQAMQPDTTLEINGLSYFNHPNFRYNAVTGISFKQAEEYCKWRSQVVNKNLAKGKSMGTAYKISYRLPQPEELTIIPAKPRKIHVANGLTELTANQFVLVSEPLKQNAATLPSDGNATQTQTFRCVAYFEKR